MQGLLVILIFAVMLVLNVPVAISLGVASFAYLFFMSPLPVDIVVQSFVSGVDSFTLLAVPFFILAGDVMMEGGISKRLIMFCRVCMGKKIGALGMVTVFASMIFAAISGSGPATVACIGGIMIPAMIKERYDRSYSCTLASCAGALGPIIPPSLSFIMYGVSAQLSITELFLAGIVPGILMGIALMVYNRFIAKRHGFGPGTPGYEQAMLAEGGSDQEELPSLGKATKEAIWSLMVPVIILGGIYGGIFTPTEAAVVASVYAILIGLFVYREIKFKDLAGIFRKSVLTSGTVMILVACATAFGRVLTMEHVPTAVAQIILGLSTNKYVVLLLINVFLFIVGMLMETLAAIIILTPILLPVVTQLGVDPIHFGVIMVVNLVIGMCTPPVGVNLFVGARLGGIKVEKMFKWLVPMVGVLLIVLMAVTYIEPISTFLPNLVKILSAWGS